MGNQTLSEEHSRRSPSELKGCVVIQTCDSYRFAWESLFWSMKKYWDYSIPWPIFFCNEEMPIAFFEDKHKQLLTGKGSHSSRLAFILDSLQEYDYIFYMLEDFWPTDRMTKEMFMGLFEVMAQNNWDGLRVANHQPQHYKLESTDHFFDNRRILKYAADSKWKFSQQATFWKREFLRDIIIEPTHSETMISSSLTGEIAMDENLNLRKPNAQIYHYHYFWYPVSGSVWRGQLSEVGRHIDFIRQVERLIDDQFESPEPMFECLLQQ